MLVFCGFAALVGSGSVWGVQNSFVMGVRFDPTPLPTGEGVRYRSHQLMPTRVGEIMKKRFGLVLAAGALMTTLWAGAASAIPNGPPAGAAGPPIGGCPTSAAGWFLVTPSGPDHVSAQYDFNGDNRVCARFIPGLVGQPLPVAFMDNVVR
jgi:hypothetical protein